MVRVLFFPSLEGKPILATFDNHICAYYHIAVKAYQVPTCTGTRSTILLRLVCGRTPVATLGMWADPGRALSVGSGAKRRVGSDIGKHTIKNFCNHD
eukprot:COSAG02_NODE_521_length_20750_cov_10.721079_22_plen_97_part_00